MIGKILDRFEVKGPAALQYGATGVVVIVKHEPAPSPLLSGDNVLLVRPDGWLYRGDAEDVRIESTTSTTGFFLRGLQNDDVPLESEVRWGSDLPSLNTAVA